MLPLLVTVGMATLLSAGVDPAWAGSAVAKTGSTGNGSGLALVTPTEAAQTIQLEPLPNSLGGYDGHLTIAVKNKESKPGRVAVAFLQAGGARFDALSSASGSPVEPASPIPDPPPVLRPGQVRPVQLEFALPKGKPAAWLDGTLLLRLRKIGKKGTGPAPTLVPVKAEFLSLTNISFEPSDLALQVTGGDLEGGGTVNLVGPAAEQLLGRTPPFTATVLVGNDEGNRASVTIDELQRVGDGTVAATVAVEGVEAGKYTGALALGQGSAAPKLPITLNARSCLALAVGLILLSSLVGGLLPAFSSTARTRALLRVRLKTAIERFEEQYDSPDNKPLLLWDMTVTMGPRPWLGRSWSSVTGAEGVAGRYAELKWARSDDDLKALATEVDEAITEIGRWLLVFERAKELQALLGRRGVPVRKGGEWEATKIAIDAEEFLDGLRRAERTTDNDARELAIKCIERRRWYALVLEAWTKIARAEQDPALPDVARTALGQKDLSPFTSVGFPKSTQLAPLGAELARVMREARALVPKLDRYADEPSAETFDAFVESASLADKRSPNLMAGVEDESKRLEAEHEISAQDRSGEEALQRLSVLDWMVTAVLALGATFAYTVPLYDSTWGTTTDVLTALAVGFGTQVVVQWAAMPIFRSIRTAKAGDDSPAAEGSPAKA